jgi:ABC-type multidrug transport system fused ATPase/permease subunit
MLKKEGLEMLLTENGTNLSSGERQLICICRAILRSSRVVILDEATANIDVVTEQKIQTLIANEFKESTMLTIAHRLNTIISSDKVMVLSYGKILEFDSPQKLMQDPKSEFSGLLKEIEKEENGKK